MQGNRKEVNMERYAHHLGVLEIKTGVSSNAVADVLH